MEDTANGPGFHDDQIQQIALLYETLSPHNISTRPRHEYSSSSLMTIMFQKAIRRLSRKCCFDHAFFFTRLIVKHHFSNHTGFDFLLKLSRTTIAFRPVHDPWPGAWPGPACHGMARNDFLRHGLASPEASLQRQGSIP